MLPAALSSTAAATCTRLCFFLFLGKIGHRWNFDGKMRWFEAAAVDDGAMENDGFRGGKRRKSDGKVMGFVGFPAWMAGGDSAYAKLRT